jgi:hypothetical protein
MNNETKMTTTQILDISYEQADALRLALYRYHKELMKDPDNEDNRSYARQIELLQEKWSLPVTK